MLLAAPRRAKFRSRSWSRTVTYDLSLVCPGSSHRSRQRRCSWQLYTNASVTKRVNWVQPTWSYTRLPLLIREEIELYQNRDRAFPSKKVLWNLIDNSNEEHELDNYHNDVSAATRTTEEPVDMSKGWFTARERDMLISQLNEQHRQSVKFIQKTIDTFFLPVPGGTEMASGSLLRLDSPSVFNQSLVADKLFDHFRSMPSGRLAYFDDSTRDGLFEYLMTAAKQDRRMTPILLTFLDEVREAQLPVPHRYHDLAIRLTSQQPGTVTPESATDALGRWEMMEKVDGIPANIATFNILLDIAVKARYFALFDSLMDMIKERRLRITAGTLMALISYYGHREDGDGIRRTFREFLKRGFEIDTPVLNCVIASLLRADEAGAAHAVYCRMKDWAVTASQEEAELKSNGATASIEISSKTVDTDQERRLQRLRNMTPNTKTYRIFIEHCASKSGDFHNAAHYLGEMQAAGIAPDGSIFLHLFRAFSNYGNQDYTWWTQEKLEDVWQAFSKLVNEKRSDVYIGKWVVIWMLRAYVRCYGRETALKKWMEIKSQWSEAEEYQALMVDIISTAFTMRGSAHYGTYSKAGFYKLDITRANDDNV